MDIGRALTLWTVRLAVVCYGIALWRFLSHERRHSVARSDLLHAVSGITAWVLCILHVILAFAFFHHGSHQAAYDYTAAVTERVTGMYWGGGLYVNYVFLIVWGYVAIRNVIRMPVTSGSVRLETAFHVIAVFLVFNATAVFGPSWWRMAILAVVVAVASVFVWKRTC